MRATQQLIPDMTHHLNTSLITQIKDYFFIIVGLSLYAFGFTAFILPQKLVMGGVSGVASLLYYKFGLNVAVMGWLINFVLLAFAYRTLGKQFCLRTLFGVTIVNVMIGIMQQVIPTPFFAPDDRLMNLMIGSILIGIGVGICFVHNGSTGGTDIVAATVNKLYNVTVGRVMIYVDWCIISSSYLVFQSVDTIVYGFIIVTMVSYLADQMINTNRESTQFTVISSKWHEISAAVLEVAHRGCTVINGTGGYSGAELKMLLIMCRKLEAVTIFRIIQAIDPNAFITQVKVDGVYGMGFDKVKVKANKKEASEAQAVASKVAEHIEAEEKANQQ